jgi:DNA invertase Pin-like site-specific DNA recombinase
MDTTTPAGQLQLALFGAFAEFERNLIRERSMAGIAAARAQGRLTGRKCVLTSPQVRYAKRMRAAGVPVTEIAAGLSCGRATVYRALLRVA